MTIAKCKICGETVITVKHLEDKKNVVCYDCSEKTNNKNHSQQIKKDDNLMGKSSGDTKMGSGSNNHLKDFQSDNQSADLLYFAGKESHNALVKDTKERTIKQVIKYLEDRGYKVIKKTESNGGKNNDNSTT